MRRMVMVAAALVAMVACQPDAEESTTAEELLEGEDSVIRAGTVAPESVSLRGQPTTAADTVARDSAVLRDSTAQQDTGVRPRSTPRP